MPIAMLPGGTGRRVVRGAQERRMRKGGSGVGEGVGRVEALGPEGKGQASV